MFLEFFIFYLLSSCFFFSDFFFFKKALCLIISILPSCSNTLNLESIFEYIRQKLKKQAHFKISSRDEVFTRLFFFHPRMKFRQKRLNSKRHFSIDRNDFVPGRVSSQDEISRVSTL